MRLDARPETRARTAPEPPAANGAWLPVVGDVQPGDLLAPDDEHPGKFSRTNAMADPRVLGVATELRQTGPEGLTEVWVAMVGVATVQVDAGYGEIRSGDSLVVSPTPGHAMGALEAVPGTIIGNAIDGLEIGTGTIRVLFMRR